MHHTRNTLRVQRNSPTVHHLRARRTSLRTFLRYKGYISPIADIYLAYAGYLPGVIGHENG